MGELDVLHKAEAALVALENHHLSHEVKARETFDAFVTAHLFAEHIAALRIRDPAAVNHIRAKLWNIISAANRHPAVFTKDDVRGFEHIADTYGKE